MEIKIALTEREYQILQKLDRLPGENSEKIRSLLRWYISTLPELKPVYYAMRRDELKVQLEESLRDVWGAYETTQEPVEKWPTEKIENLVKTLTGINVLRIIGDRQYIPTNQFRTPFKMVLHDIVTESPDMNEYSAACIATSLLLIEFGGGTLNREELRDATIFLDEGWLFVYATAIKKAREFQKTKKLHPAEQVAS